MSPSALHEGPPLIGSSDMSLVEIRKDYLQKAADCRFGLPNVKVQFFRTRPGTSY